MARLALVLLGLATACGYSFTAAGRLTGGFERVAVEPFANASAEPELAAALSGALRTELAKRGNLAAGTKGPVLSGEVTAGAPVPGAAGGVSWRVAVEVTARLRDGEKLVAERKVRREADYSAGIDALETEGRRAAALRRLAEECARDLAAAFTGP